ncbi:MAG: hypothetical protein RJB08_285, partial [Actinomycetota bacterium]
MAVVLVDAAKAKPNEIAIRDSSLTMTWPELNSAINRVVNNLKPRDLGPNRRIAVYSENSLETALAHMAALHAGLSSVPVNFHLNAEEAAYILNDSGTRLLFTGPENLARAIEAVAQLSTPIPIVVWRASGALPTGVESFEALMASTSDAEPIDDVAPRPNMLYTSGTTGFPKGVDLPPTMFAGG